MRAFTTAVATGVAVGVMVYRVLRSGDDGEGQPPSDGSAEEERPSFEAPRAGEETKESESGTGEVSHG